MAPLKSLPPNPWGLRQTKKLRQPCDLTFVAKLTIAHNDYEPLSGQLRQFRRGVAQCGHQIGVTAAGKPFASKGLEHCVSSGVDSAMGNLHLVGTGEMAHSEAVFPAQTQEL